MKKKNEDLTIESEKVFEVISEAKAALTSTILYYGFVIMDEDTKRIKAKEERAVIDGSKFRLEKLGLSKEEIDKIDWSLDPNIIVSYKEWCHANNKDFTHLESMEEYQNQGGNRS